MITIVPSWAQDANHEGSGRMHRPPRRTRLAGDPESRIIRVCMHVRQEIKYQPRRKIFAPYKAQAVTIVLLFCGARYIIHFFDK